jgi:UDP-N-acetylmuramoyl-tripeptide--D-alanyl-D-alanine ligase
MIFSKEELSKIFKTKVEKNIDDICVDSRKAKPGDLFIALKGENVDGHDFIKSAFASGAILALVQCENRDCERNLIKVDSTYQGLLNLAKYNVAQTNAKYIGVTGSIGKTTTKNLIHHLLSKFFPNEVYATKRNFNSKIGLPICAACMNRNTKIGIFEMGMSEFGDIKNLIKIVAPNISVITHICETHLEFFNSIWDIAKAKSEIMETEIPQDSVIIPADSAYTDFLKNKAKKFKAKNVFTFGFSKSDAQITSQKQFEDKTEIVANILGKKVKYCVNCHNNSVIPNSLAAILAAHAISKIDIQDLANEVENFSATNRRGEIFEKKGVTIIDDSYNACYSSVRSAIKSLAKYSGRKILAIGDMKELGKDSRFFHENLSPSIDRFGIDLVFACGELSKYLFENLREEKRGGWYENSQKLSENIISKIQNGDKILVKGSNSMEMNKIVETITHAL